MRRRDQSQRPHALLTDEPGVVVHDPRRQLIRLLALYAVLPLICAAAGAFIAYSLANERTDRRIAAAERTQAAYLAERRQVNADADARRDQQLRQFRADLCVLVDRVQPQDAAVLEVRRRYGCAGPTPALAPAPTVRPSGQGGVSPGWPPSGRPGGGGSSAGGGVAGPPSAGGGAVRPSPAPQGGVSPPAGPRGPSGPPGPPGPAAPAPVPAPTSGSVVELCLPVLDLCVL